MERREIAQSKGLGDCNNKKEVAIFEKSNVSWKFHKIIFWPHFIRRKIKMSDFENMKIYDFLIKFLRILEMYETWF